MTVVAHALFCILINVNVETNIGESTRKLMNLISVASVAKLD